MQYKSQAAPTGASALTGALSTPPTPRSKASHLELVGLDVELGQARLAERETEILNRVSLRILEGRFDLPQMPATSVAVLNLTSGSLAEIQEIVHAIEADPVLTSELIKTANSVVYTGTTPVETIAEAIMRIGLRNLRTLMFSVSVRGVVLRDKRFSKYGEEVWRQSYSMASIARALAKTIGTEPDRAFLLGLLADIGKVSLLSMLRQELPGDDVVSPALVGRMFNAFHEQAGAAMAEAWHLPEDIKSVVGCHHKYEENEHSPRDSALVSLANRLDVLLSMDDDKAAHEAFQAPEFEYFGLGDDQRWAVLEAARGAFSEAGQTV